MNRNADLTREVATIGDLDREELAARWRRIYGCPPPMGVRRELLTYAIAWDLQRRRIGGLPAETRRALKKAVDRASAMSIGKGRSAEGVKAFEAGSDAPGTGTLARTSTPVPGNRLIREWSGKTNVVDVVQGGFLFEGKSYRSLSAIARKITGAHWSGPRFFGL